MSVLWRMASRLRPARRMTAALLACLAVLIALFFGGLAALGGDPPGDRLRLDELSALLDGEKVAAAVLRDQDKAVELRLRDGRRAWTSYPSSDSLTATLVTAFDDAGVRAEVDAQSTQATLRVVITVLLPLLVLANLFALILLGRRGGGDDAISGFGTMDRRDGGIAEPPATRFGDVAGAGEAVAELAEVVSYLREPGRYAALSAVPPKGVLLFGSPGTGKTLLARAVAGEAGVPFFAVAGAEFVESLVGVGAARVRDLFSRVRAAAPAILFVDEIDALGRRRGGESGGSDEREQTLNQLLVEMDGFAAAAGVVVLGATNRPDILDPALLRPGRFDRHVTLEPPDAEGRAAILRVHSAARPIDADVDFMRVAARTPGCTGADLANLCNEAALLAVRAGRPSIGRSEFEEALERVLHGPRGRAHILDEDERRLAAVHEAGHAVVASLVGHASVERLTVLPRGRRLGATALGEDADRLLFTRSRLLNRLTVTAAGAAAEQLLCGERSTGSELDLEEATSLAQEIVARFGMSDAVGPVRLLAPGSVDFVGTGPRLGALAPTTHELLDQEVARLLREAHERAAGELSRHREAVEDLADALLEQETLEGERLAAHLNPLRDVDRMPA